MTDFARYPLYKLTTLGMPQHIVQRVRDLVRDRNVEHFYFRHELAEGSSHPGFFFIRHSESTTKPKLGGRGHKKLYVMITQYVSQEQWDKEQAEKAAGKAKDAVNDQREQKENARKRASLGEWKEAV